MDVAVGFCYDAENLIVGDVAGDGKFQILDFSLSPDESEVLLFVVFFHRHPV